MFIIIYCCQRYKKVIIIDEKKEKLIICDKGIIPCCKLNQRSFPLKNIKNVKIYTTWLNAPNFGTDKLYYINGMMYSFDERRELLFYDVNYDKETYDKFISFFQRHLKTEVEPLEVSKNKFGDPIGNRIYGDEKEYPEKTNIDTKQSMDENTSGPLLP